jgi:phosphotransferase system HPr (HPr) family protein
MRTKKVTVRTKNGLHMRIAGRIIDKSSASQSKITFRKGQSSADARSIIDLLTLAVTEGAEIEIVADGSDEEKILSELEQVLIDGAGI